MRSTPENEVGDEAEILCPFLHTTKVGVFIIAQSIPDEPVYHRENPLPSIAVVAVLHLPGRKGQDLERRVVDPVLLKQHLLDRADDRFVVW
jgi:hypothetical protein